MDDIKRTIDGKEICMCHNGVSKIHDVVNNSAKCLSCIWRGIDLYDHNSPKDTHFIYCRKDNNAVNMYNAAGCSSFEQMTPEEFADFINHEQGFLHKKICIIDVEENQSKRFTGYIGYDRIGKITVTCDPDTFKLVLDAVSKIQDETVKENETHVYFPLNVAMTLYYACAEFVKKKYNLLYHKITSIPLREKYELEDKEE